MDFKLQLLNENKRQKLKQTKLKWEKNGWLLNNWTVFSFLINYNRLKN